MQIECGQIVKCPKTVAESGFLKVFGIDESIHNHLQLSSAKGKGTILVREWLPLANRCKPESPFYCTREEIESWD